ncbi:hypothetical protein LTR84_006512 [Exophiala bonariae]|uniref:Uracil-DNA glycosylase-like domain-containing protein n=1 Tax=Exophiala bonariae TaxID=1690606 RepID=A0AAV9N0W8_9EURO|nr:hypothetical protein LTR84_006512 [Exophiala bonariae]
MDKREPTPKDSGLSSDSEDPAKATQDAFRSRLRKFEYPIPLAMASQRRSSRLAIAGGSPLRVEPTSTLDGSSSGKRRRTTKSGTLSSSTDIQAKEEEVDAERLSEIATTRPKKKRSTTKERSAQDPHSPVNNLVDSIRPGLVLVMIGLNPGLMTAATGHAYAHPSNRFWHILHASGVTPKKHIPSETRDLMDLYQIGNTNICARPTRSGDGLTKQEMEEGAVILDRKIADFRPQAVVIVGKSIWEAIWMTKKGQKRFKDPDFHWGWQDEEMQLGRIVDGEDVVWPGAKTFVATSTSGLAATMRPAEKLEVWKPLGEWMMARRQKAESHVS